MMKRSKIFIFLYFNLFFIFNSTFAQTDKILPKYEFRAVWIATVANIDWPTKNTDSIDRQKEDFIKILDTYKKLNFNAVIVQIRSNGDAIYSSKYSPWSRNLTGVEGKELKFDILEWMIAESHLRGFEFHAWLNPFRATFDLKNETLSNLHDAKKHPEWMIKYAGKYYYNPGLPEVQDHLTKIVEEVVQNYDIDAIHFDDYFYPYTINSEKFDDTASFLQYGKGKILADWRRENVNNFVKKISGAIKVIKPWVQFGISPFGVWKNKTTDPKGSDTQTGQTNYDNLYADPLVWMQNNWIDYLIPQLYWSMSHPKASYSKLVNWWSENTQNTALYIGNSSYKIKSDTDKNWDNINEIPNQIDYARNFENIKGNAFFSAKWFMDKNKDVTTVLMENQYKYPAIPPVTPNLKKDAIETPRLYSVYRDYGLNEFNFYPVQSKIRYLVIYGFENEENANCNDPKNLVDKIILINNTDRLTAFIPYSKIEKFKYFAFSYIDYYGNESSPTYFQL